MQAPEGSRVGDAREDRAVVADPRMEPSYVARESLPDSAADAVAEKRGVDVVTDPKRFQPALHPQQRATHLAGLVHRKEMGGELMPRCLERREGESVAPGVRGNVRHLLDEVMVMAVDRVVELNC